MAKLSVTFEIENFPMALEIGDDTSKFEDLMKYSKAIIKSIKNHGGRPIGAIAKTQTCQAAYVMASKGTTAQTRNTTYYRVYGKPGTWIQNFGVAIYNDPGLFDMFYSVTGIDLNQIELNKEYPLSAKVEFELETDSETGKQNPKRVIMMHKE